MMMPMQIVPIREDYIDGFHRTLDFVARERRYLAFLEAPPIEEVRGFVRDIIKRGYPQYVAIASDDVVGWCDVVPMNRPVFAHIGVLGMGLLPPFRRRGIGTDLIRATLTAARTFGLHRVELTVWENNTGAIELYKKAGFAIEGLRRDAVQIDGVLENALAMALLL
jgi:RimJ/RimL family protein N-acetyltransferase